MKILIVIVLYKTSIDNSISLSRVRSIISANDNYRGIFDVLIIDNGPIEQTYTYHLGTYVYNKENIGVAGAYNYALKLAMEKNISWLLLLDQDTTLCEEYLDSAVVAIQSMKKDSKIVTLVPSITCNKKIISPYYRSSIKQRVLKKTISSNREYYNISALNSGSVVNVAFMESIGGFNSIFWLDYLDHWLFYKIFKMGRTVYVLNSIMEHNLSVAKGKSNIPTERYLNILFYEAVYYTNFCNAFELIIYLNKVIFRLFKNYRHIKSNYMISEYFKTIIKGILAKV